MAGTHQAKKKVRSGQKTAKKAVGRGLEKAKGSPAKRKTAKAARVKSGTLARRGGERSAALGLPSGRLVRVTGGADGEAIEVRSADGSLEVRIGLTPDGPVLSLKGVRLKIDAAEGVEVNCRDFAIRAERSVGIETGGDVGIRTQGEVRMKAMKQAFIDAEMVNLNCLDRSDYPPVQQQAETGAQGKPEPHDAGCGCDGENCAEVERES